MSKWIDDLLIGLKGYDVDDKHDSLIKKIRDSVVLNLAANGGFFDWTANVPDNWSKEGNPTTAQATVKAGCGYYAIQITAVATNEGIKLVMSGMQPSTTYKVKVYAKANTGDTARVLTTGASVNMDVTTTDTDWTLIIDTFTTDGAGADVTLKLLGQASGDVVYFCGVVVQGADFAWDILTNIVPVGTGPLPYPGATAPDGWFLCDGSVKSRTVYAGLYAVVTDQFGADGSLSTRTDDDTGVITVVGGNRGLTTSETVDVSWSGGSRTGMSITTVNGALITVDGGSGDVLPTQGTAVTVKPATNVFLLPDLRGRVPIGKDDMGGTSADRITDTEADTLGDYGGEEDHVLTEAELAAHTHAFDYGPMSMNLSAGAGAQGGVYAGSTMQSAGGDQAHNNVQPFVTLNYIIKY